MGASHPLVFPLAINAISAFLHALFVVEVAQKPHKKVRLTLDTNRGGPNYCILHKLIMDLKQLDIKDQVAESRNHWRDTTGTVGKVMSHAQNGALAHRHQWDAYHA